nr:MAG TPA: hypothetical protein [Caudoviricetes sp.]
MGTNEQQMDDIQEEAGPQDIAAAFQQFKQQRQQDSEPEMEVSEPDEEGVEGASGEPVEVDDGGDGEVPVEPAPVPEAVDYNGIGRNIVNEINRQAAIQANEEFSKRGIRKMSVKDLYERDEQRGIVTYRNPENRNRPFEKRTEAQEYCDSVNRDIEAEWKNLARERQMKILNDVAPALRMIQFAPKFDSLDDDTKEMFDTVIEPYEIKNRQGEIVGYSCDLDAALAQAKRIMSKIASKRQAPAQQAQSASRKADAPAVDTPTGARPEGINDKEPTNLGEAMKMYNEMKKGRR